MTGSPNEQSSSQTESIAAARSREAADESESLLETSMDELPAEWQERLRIMQECICELLIKNQQLRMALMEAKAAELRNANGPDA